MSAPSSSQRYATCLGDFADDILVRCPRCSSCAHLLRLKNPEDALAGRRLVCASCAQVVDWDLSSLGSVSVPGSGPRLVGFDLDLWLTTPCCGETLWAYNREHVAFLESHIAARLRPHPRHPDHGWANGSLQSRLPRWMLDRHHRDAVLLGLQKLLAGLPRTD